MLRVGANILDAKHLMNDLLSGTCGLVDLMIAFPLSQTNLTTTFIFLRSYGFFISVHDATKNIRSSIVVSSTNTFKNV